MTRITAIPPPERKKRVMDDAKNARLDKTEKKKLKVLCWATCTPHKQDPERRKW